MLNQRTNSIFLSFLYWFFVFAPIQGILRVGVNFLRWGWKYFSIGYLSLRIFSPWHKDLTSYGRGFDFKRWAHTLGWNLISRFIGAILRIVVVVMGLIAEFLIILLSLLVFVAWYLLPVLIVLMIIFGIIMIFSQS